MRLRHARRRPVTLRTTAAAQRGSTLVIALVFMVVFTLLLTGLLGYIFTNSHAGRSARHQRDVQYAADGALEAAINWVGHSPTLGRDPNYFASIPPCLYQQPSSGAPVPDITVECAAVPGTGSGRREEPGIVPDTAILTLGRRYKEPGAYNDNTDCTGRNEEGILVRETASCTGLFGPDPAPRGPWNVVGPVASNSTITFDAGTLSARTASGGAAPVIARSGCGVQATPACQVVGEGSTSSLLQDPGYAPRPLTVDGRVGGTPLPVRTMPTTCAGPLTTIEPGVYTSAQNVNALFASPSCRDRYVWFKPGVYYFNFLDGGNTFSQCGNALDLNFFGSDVRYEPQYNRHLWCIGATNNTNLHVVGGTPFGWDGANPPALGLGFPRQITANDPGGDCDPTLPGVQFIFGGDSRLYVADGTFELCAGPDPNGASNRPQIPLYGVPALPEITAPTATGGAGVSNASNARVIGEPAGPVGGAAATLNFRGQCGGSTPQSVGCFAGFGGGTIESNPLTLSGFGNGFSIPAGTAVQKVEMRASYYTNAFADGVGASPEFRISGPGFDCGANQSLPPQSNTAQREIDVTACLGGGNAGRLSSGFNVEWTARGTTVCIPVAGCTEWNDTLEGIQFVVTVAATNVASTLTPQSGCIVDHPNYQDGIGRQDCPVFKVDQNSNRATILSIPIAGSSGWVGRASFKGTVYAPSAAIDFADQDAQYPLFSRGLVARHLRLKAYYSQANIPMSSVQIDPKVFERQVDFTACSQAAGGTTSCKASEGDVILGTARVTYRVDIAVPSTSPCHNPNPATQEARCPEIQQYSVERTPVAVPNSGGLGVPVGDDGISDGPGDGDGE